MTMMRSQPVCLAESQYLFKQFQFSHTIFHSQWSNDYPYSFGGDG